MIHLNDDPIPILVHLERSASDRYRVQVLLRFFRKRKRILFVENPHVCVGRCSRRLCRCEERLRPGAPQRDAFGPCEILRAAAKTSEGRKMISTWRNDRRQNSHGQGVHGRQRSFHCRRLKEEMLSCTVPAERHAKTHMSRRFCRQQQVHP